MSRVWLWPPAGCPARRAGSASQGPQPGASAAGHGGAQRSRLDSILKGVAGQVGGLLWDAPESDPAAADDDDGEGTAGVLAPA